ncbi:TonB-dependent receptor, partial [Escherichia coli]|nr:TonB-dependent receptor [Escherichia coli]
DAGVRYQHGRLFSGSATVFRTNFRNQNYNFADPINPSQQSNITADLRTNGIELNLNVRPVDYFSIDFQGVFQDPKLVNLAIN